MDEIILGKTRSICPICLDVIDAYVVLDKKYKRVYIKKKCKKHGEFKVIHFWDDPDVYRNIIELSKSHNPRFYTFTLDLTRRCNMNCPFCGASASIEKNNDLSIDNIERILKKISKKYGRRGYVSLFGGEPTVREDLPEIIKLVKKYGFEPILLTNGIKLADENYVKKLKDAGLRIVSLSFDGLDDDVYMKLRGGRYLRIKEKALENLCKYNFYVSLESMIVSEVNDDQVCGIINYSLAKCVRSLTFIPFIFNGRMPYIPKRLTSGDIINRISKCFDLDKKDFIEMTRFDFIITGLLNLLNVTKTFPTYRLVLYLVRENKNDFLPLSRVINIRLFNVIFSPVVKVMNRSDIIARILFFLLLPLIVLMVNPKYIKHAMRLITHSDNSLFELSVLSYQDRFNMDLDTIINSPILYVTPDGEFLEFSWEYIHE